MFLITLVVSCVATQEPSFPVLSKKHSLYQPPQKQGSCKDFGSTDYHFAPLPSADRLRQRINSLADGAKAQRSQAKKPGLSRMDSTGSNESIYCVDEIQPAVRQWQDSVTKHFKLGDGKYHGILNGKAKANVQRSSKLAREDAFQYSPETKRTPGWNVAGSFRTPGGPKSQRSSAERLSTSESRSNMSLRSAGSSAVSESRPHPMLQARDTIKTPTDLVMHPRASKDTKLDKMSRWARDLDQKVTKMERQRLLTQRK